MNLVLLSTAATIGIFHTAIGVDHYIPFVAMSTANKWSFAKTMLIVLLCGIGHVLSSVILGLCGIWLGSQLSFLVGIEDLRGELAAWFLLAFGAVYMLWGIRNAVKRKHHGHTHAEGTHRSFWPLFILLVLGPCEPLIPLLMVPAADTGMLSVAAVAAVFSVCTVATMLLCTAVVLKGVHMIPMKKLERFSHALAGFAVLMCGAAIQIFGI